MSRRSANFLLLLAGVVWGAGFVAQQTAMEDIGPFLFMALRFLLATLVVLPFALWEYRTERGSRLTNQSWLTTFKLATLVGLLFFGTMVFQQIGLILTTVTSAGFLTGLYVIIVPLIVLLILRQSQHWIVWPGALMALAGIYLLGNGGFSGLNFGDILVIIAAVIGAGHIVMLGYTVQQSGRPIQTATIQFAVSALISVAGYFLFQLLPLSFTGAGAQTTQLLEPPAMLDPVLRAAPEILYAGIFAGGLAFSLMAIGQRYTREADAAILLSSEALFAALFAALLLGERLSLQGYIGCLLIFAAIMLVQLLPARGTKLANETVG